jgi:hypothetical protein
MEIVVKTTEFRPKSALKKFHSPELQKEKAPTIQFIARRLLAQEGSDKAYRVRTGEPRPPQIHSPM